MTCNSFQIALEDLQSASLLLCKALRLREKYMDTALQSFPSVTRRFIHPPGSVTSSYTATSFGGATNIEAGMMCQVVKFN